jgi:hypothetical protein
MAKQKGTPKSSPQQLPADEVGGAYVSGKLVISTIVAVAVLAAGFSWWFRYSATRQAARFWGPQHVLVRDAKNVQLVTLGPMGADESHVHDSESTFADHYHTMEGVVKVVDRRDVTDSHGLIHLRTELLQDRSYEWATNAPAATVDWKYGLEFRDATTSPPLLVLFSSDCRRLLRHPPTIGSGAAILSPSFADGLKTVFTEWQTEQR